MTRIINEIDKKIFLEEKCFIPTMGALHKGHLSLVKLGKQSTNGKTIVSIFVNRRQFNDESDYDNYPIDLDKDIELLRKEEVDYKGSPDQLLESIKIIENDMGRESTFRYGPRLIDIDIIFFNNYEVNQDNLTIPHYDWKNRLFVLEPLYEVLELELNKSEYKINGQKVKRVGSINL